MKSFFVIAEDELVLAFRLVGVEGRAARNRSEALDAFHYATGSGRDEAGARYPGIDAKVLILTQEIAALLEEETRAWQYAGAYPLIVEIPGTGASPEGRQGLVDAIRQAVGISI